MKKTIAILAVLWAAPVFAQNPTTAAPPAVATSGGFTAGVLNVDNSSNSAKLTEYRDLKDNFYVPRLTFSVKDPGTGWFFDLSGTNVSRDDQTVFARAGRSGVWSADVLWVETPHNYSNKAVTPYIQRVPGLFTVPAPIPITYKKLATSAADTPGVLASDDLMAAYQSTYLAPTPLATQTNAGHFALAWSGSDVVALGAAYDRTEKQGLKPTFGPIGDRPPRSLNIQLTEPVDYRTNDVTLSAEHEGRGYQVRAEYLYSDFANQIDTLKWQNVFATPAPGSDYDVWDRAVGAYGARPLPPDNRYHNATVNAGVDMPHESRLMGSLSYGRLEQNATLLPYATAVGVLANQALPRSTADASMNTVNFAADYVISPVSGMNLRAFFRQYTLSNDTPSSNWQYVTSDTSNLNGTVSYVNKRVSAPYAWDRQNAGAEGTWRVGAWRSSLTFGYEHEAIGREHREADTSENILRAEFRARPANWVSVQGRYRYGSRDGSEYYNQVTREGYWYAPAEATDFNNPGVSFDNHPDMRRYDVSDRQRQQFDLRVNLTPKDVYSVSAFLRYRGDDYDSGVTPSQPLLGTTSPEPTATSPGQQLGLLEDARLRYGLDVFVQPNPRVTFNAFLNYDNGTSFQRSMEFNENNKQNPSTIATAELGPWTRASNQWTADFDDRTWSGGVGTTLQLVPDRLTLSAEYTVSLADVDITYAGYGVTNWDGTPFPANHQFSFTSPPTINENLHVLNLRFEIPVKVFTVILGYSYESYALTDWQQGSSQPWVESVGTDTLLRDTSRSFQWGNRLFNLGTYLSPSYDAHIGFVGLSYRF